METNNPPRPEAPKGDNFVITVGRRFGSGGRELGRLLAERLGIAYYDKELLAEAARRSGLSCEFFERHDERFPRYINGLFSFAQGYQPINTYAGGSAIGGDSAHQAMNDMIRALAERESCVIVGRTADYILRDHPRCVNIFVHAPEEHCIDRIMRRGDIDDRDKAHALARKTNKLRAHYYNFFTDKRWGDAGSYHLTIDSSAMTMEQVADTVIDYLRHRGLIGSSSSEGDAPAR